MTRPLRFGILGCASIARRMMLPAFAELTEAIPVAVAARDRDRAAAFAAEFGIAAAPDYDALLAREDVDAVYLPLPPALHEHWALRALAAGKHVLCEKPLATSLTSAERLVAAARQAGRVLAENWMFMAHRQLATIDALIADRRLGPLRLLRASFGFPALDPDNFRYRGDLGGGALLDAGGYTLRIARRFLGDPLRLVGGVLETPPGSTVDRFGSALLAGDGATAQVAFGFDTYYQCELQLWLARGKITAPRIFTAPPGFTAEIVLETASGRETVTVPPDNHFAGSLRDFARRVAAGRPDFDGLLAQAGLVEEIFASQRGHPPAAAGLPQGPGND
jgi:predicted dehydrogenase